MTERSWYWGGIATGDAGLPAPYGAPYSDDMFSDIFSYMFSRDRTKQCVIPTTRTGYSDNFAETHTGGTITVGTGIAMVDGKIYSSDASIPFTPGGDGAWSVILRKTWGTQLIRMQCITTGTVTQTDGVTWDVELYRLTVSGGNITAVYDYRNFILRPETRSIAYIRRDTNYGLEWFPTGIPDSAVTVNFILPSDYMSDLQVWDVLSPSISANGTVNYRTFGYYLKYTYGSNDPRMTYTTTGPTTSAINVSTSWTQWTTIKLFDSSTTDTALVAANRGLPMTLAFDNNVGGGTYGGYVVGHNWIYITYKGI